MHPTLTTKLLVVGSVVVTTVGAVAAAIEAEWDVFVTFLLAVALGLALLVRLESRRPAIPIRRDLVAWLRDRAVQSGEPLGTVTDRALSAYRQQYGDARSDLAGVSSSGSDPSAVSRSSSGSDPSAVSRSSSGSDPSAVSRSPSGSDPSAESAAAPAARRADG